MRREKKGCEAGKGNRNGGRGAEGKEGRLSRILAVGATTMASSTEYIYKRIYKTQRIELVLIRLKVVFHICKPPAPALFRIYRNPRSFVLRDI